MDRNLESEETESDQGDFHLDSEVAGFHQDAG